MRPRLAPPAQLEDAAAAAVRPGRRPGASRSSALVGFLSGATTLGYVATGFALVAALLNAIFGFCLGCEVYLLGRRALAATPAHRQHPRYTRQGAPHEPREHSRHRPVGRGQPRQRRRSSSSRSTRTPRPTTRATSRARSSSTGRPTSRTRSVATSSTRSSSRRCCSERGVANDDTVVLYGGNNNWFAAYAYWYFKLYGHDDVKLLDGGRKKWELDSRELTDELPARAATSYTAKEQDTTHPRVPRRDRRRDRRQEPGRRAQPRRVRRPAARPGPPPAGAGPARRSHPDRGQRAVEQGGQRRRHLPRPTTSSSRSTPRPASTGARTPSPTAASASAPRTPGSCFKELLGQPNVKNYDGSWTEYGSLVGVPVALGDEAGEA